MRKKGKAEEERRAIAQAAELRRENEKLRRSIKRLRKDMQHRGIASSPDLEEDEGPAPTPRGSRKCCPGCGGFKTAQIATPSGFMLFICGSCPYRAKHAIISKP